MKKRTLVMSLSFLLAFITLLFTNCKKEQIPTVITEAVVEISSNSAICEGEVKKDGGSDVTERGFCWGLESMPNIDGNRTFDSSGVGIFSSRLIGLTPATNYYVRAYAINQLGVAYGKEIEFTTEEGAAATGSLEVFVREGAGNGPYVASALVEIFLTEGDRLTNSVFQTANTPETNPSEKGAFFEDLSPKQYFIRASYTNAQGKWMGVNEAMVYIESTTRIGVVCVL